MARYDKNSKRFENGKCKCARIADGTCKQCTVCYWCEYYKEPVKQVLQSGIVVGNGFYSGGSYFRFK